MSGCGKENARKVGWEIRRESSKSDADIKIGTNKDTNREGETNQKKGTMEKQQRKILTG